MIVLNLAAFAGWDDLSNVQQMSRCGLEQREGE
jgi:hypothetical protein